MVTSPDSPTMASKNQVPPADLVRPMPLPSAVWRGLPIAAQGAAVLGIAGLRPGRGAATGANGAPAAVLQADLDAAGVRRLGPAGIAGREPVGPYLKQGARRVARRGGRPCQIVDAKHRPPVAGRVAPEAGV